MSEGRRESQRGAAVPRHESEHEVGFGPLGDDLEFEYPDTERDIDGVRAFTLDVMDYNVSGMRHRLNEDYLEDLRDVEFKTEQSEEAFDVRSLEYLDPEQENLMCPICHAYLDEPVRLTTCDHVFCRSCIMAAFETQDRGYRRCPSCRGKTSTTKIANVPRMVQSMLDELRVKCPLADKGCSTELKRGNVMDHLKSYCEFQEVDCIDKNCTKKLSRKDCQDSCQHFLICCGYCQEEVQQLDLLSHQNTSCTGQVSCPDCLTLLLRSELSTHIEICPERVLTCTASSYGCDYASKRSELSAHLQSCTLARLGPFLSRQNAIIDQHSQALRHLSRKNTIYESTLQNMQDVLGLGPTSDPIPLPTSSSSSTTTPPLARGHPASPPFDSTASHLLSLHESLREEVARAQQCVRDLDAKVDMGFINQGLRTRDEMAHMNAALGQLRMQMQWLVNGRLQMQQRASMMRQGGGMEDGMGGTGSAGTGGDGGVENMPMRRLSDSSRQVTKL